MKAQPASVVSIKDFTQFKLGQNPRCLKDLVFVEKSLNAKNPPIISVSGCFFDYK